MLPLVTTRCVVKVVCVEPHGLVVQWFSLSQDSPCSPSFILTSRFLWSGWSWASYSDLAGEGDFWHPEPVLVQTHPLQPEGKKEGALSSREWLFSIQAPRGSATFDSGSDHWGKASICYSTWGPGLCGSNFDWGWFSLCLPSTVVGLKRLGWSLPPFFTSCSCPFHIKLVFETIPIFQLFYTSRMVPLYRPHWCCLFCWVWLYLWIVLDFWYWPSLSVYQLRFFYPRFRKGSSYLGWGFYPKSIEGHFIPPVSVKMFSPCL